MQTLASYLPYQDYTSGRADEEREGGLHRGEEEAEGDDVADDANDVAGGVGGNHLCEL
jgi:hypothetical protein